MIWAFGHFLSVLYDAGGTDALSFIYSYVKYFALKKRTLYNALSLGIVECLMSKLSVLPNDYASSP